MGKYKFDRRVLSGLSPISFLREVSERNRKIEEASDEWPTMNYPVNLLARKLHPHFQFGIILAAEDCGDARIFTVGPDKARGTKELAPFRPGQYVSVELTYGGGIKANKPYCLIPAGPDEENAADVYRFLITRGAEGGASDYILQNWAKGTSFVMSGPLGNGYFQKLRDGNHILFLAGGSGIAPVLSLAYAIARGQADTDLTVLYGAKNLRSLAFRSELEKLSAETEGRIKVIYVLSDERAEAYEYGLIDRERIRRHLGSASSVFVCGPAAMLRYIRAEISDLGFPPGHIRYDSCGDYGDPSQCPAYPRDGVALQYSVKVHIRGEETDCKVSSAASLLIGLEKAGIRVPSDCRSGSCGWCHSRLISGKVFVPEEVDGRRAADKKFGWIHPCITYPLSDLEIEIYPLSEMEE